MITRARRVLLAEDDPAVRGLYLEELAQGGFETVSVEDGSLALQALDSGPFDVLVSDVRMPGLSGMELLARVRERDATLPVILCTGSPDLLDTTQAVALNAFRYLLKPLKPRELSMSVAGACRSRSGDAGWKRDDVAARGSFDRWQAADARFQEVLSGIDLAYQPIVTIGDGEILGYEALLRCAPETRLGPLGLLAEAERLGRLWNVGRAVRRRAAAELGRLGEGPLLFVNLHDADLDDPDLYDSRAPLSAAASRVVLELSENTRLDQVQGLERKLSSLRDMGYTLAVDDLGGGNAGLGTLLHVVPGYVKLDMGLIRGVDRTPLKQAVVGSVMGLCRDQGIRVVAEGVEAAAEWVALMGLGVEYVQGFLFAPPRSLEDVQGTLVETPQAPGVDSD